MKLRTELDALNAIYEEQQKTNAQNERIIALLEQLTTKKTAEKPIDIPKKTYKPRRKAQ